MTDRTPTSMRLTEEEKRLFREAASRNGETVASWMRRVLISEARKTLRGK